MSDLLKWYRENARELPWRATRDPWAIWVSEVMLQQTQVGTVLGYYRRFLERFPTVGSLASSSVEEVLGAWSGLGYYRRARLLHEGAKEVVSQGGSVPSDVASLRRISGIGVYTASAIASIAFSVMVPVVDGNVERVLTRLRALSGDPKRAALRRELAEIARTFLVVGAAGEVNQGLMELGAMICRPTNPECGACPLSPSCLALAEGRVEEFPERRVPRKLEKQSRLTVVVRDEEGRELLWKRSEDEEVLPGTWELPWVAVEDLKVAPQELNRKYGGIWVLGRKVGVVRHAVTYRRLTVSVVSGRVCDWEATGDIVEWFREGERDRLPKSSLVEKVLKVFGDPPSPGSLPARPQV